ncbi:MAG: hypothetical protein ACE5OZ_20410 [Candidatus Heimdallarchaeota archaeon]
MKKRRSKKFDTYELVKIPFAMDLQNEVAFTVKMIDARRKRYLEVSKALGLLIAGTLVAQGFDIDDEDAFAIAGVISSLLLWLVIAAYFRASLLDNIEQYLLEVFLRLRDDYRIRNKEGRVLTAPVFFERQEQLLRGNITFGTILVLTLIASAAIIASYVTETSLFVPLTIYAILSPLFVIIMLLMAAKFAAADLRKHKDITLKLIQEKFAEETHKR